MSAAAIRSFYRLCLSTLIAVYFLILVGGVVRTTGSGMGCPDWPKCFEQWIPPTSIDQLPSDYKEKFSSYRDKKNQKFARLLSSIGMNSTAERILSDESIREEADFNPLKTYIEYINRLIGVVIGLLIIALFIRSISFRNSSPRFFWISALILVLVIIQGWFGSIVVSTNLTSWTITIHMFLALLIVGLLVYLLNRIDNPTRIFVKPFVKYLLAIGMILLLVQVFFGTEVRSAIDRVADQAISRSEWISSIGGQFLLHRSFSWVVLIVNLSVILAIRKTTSTNPLSITLVLLILLTVLTGAGMAYFGVPAFLQPIHLLIATIAFGCQLLLFLRLKSANINTATN